MEVLALIPARGGSKALPRKNVRLLAGRPLIAYSIEVALAAAPGGGRAWGTQAPMLEPGGGVVAERIRGRDQATHDPRAGVDERRADPAVRDRRAHRRDRLRGCPRAGRSAAARRRT